MRQPITLKFSHFLGRGSFFEVDFVQPWARELEARTGGTVKVEIYNDISSFGAVTNQASQVKDGLVDIALGLRAAEANRFPRSAIIERPFAARNALTGSQALWKLYREGALGNDYQGYKVLALFVHNPGHIHTAVQRIVNPTDVRDLRLRAPNTTVAAILESIGTIPVILQVNEVMPAVMAGRLDGIVTNWGNPLPGFIEAMKFHVEIAFYTSAFFVVMNQTKFDGLPTDVRAAIDGLSNDALVTRLGQLWTKWDKPVRDGAVAAGHEIVTPDVATLALWRDALRSRDADQH